MDETARRTTPRGPRSSVVEARRRQYGVYVGRLEALGLQHDGVFPSGDDCTDDTLLTAAEAAVTAARREWKDAVYRARLMSRRVCSAADAVLSDGSAGPTRALLASTWRDPDHYGGVLGDWLKEVTPSERRPTVADLAATPPKALLCTAEAGDEPHDLFVLWGVSVKTEEELRAVAGEVLGDGPKGAPELWEELKDGNARLVREESLGVLCRVVHACNVLVTRREWADGNDARRGQVALELYDLSVDDQFIRKVQPPSARMPASTSVGGGDEKDALLRDYAAKCLKKELGLEWALDSLRWEAGSQVHAQWCTSPSYPALRTLLFIHVVRASILGMPESALFQTDDQDQAGRRHYWQWCPVDLVPTVASMHAARLDRPGATVGRGAEFVELDDWHPPEPRSAALTKKALRALVTRDGWTQVSVRPLHGGKSGSLVLQMRGCDTHGRPRTPAIAKIDDWEDAAGRQVLEDEWNKHNAMRAALGTLHVPDVSLCAVVRPEDGGPARAAMSMELAGAAWFNPDISPHCHIVELADLYEYERDSATGGVLAVTGALAEVSVNRVVDQVFGDILRPKEVQVKRISLVHSPKVASKGGNLVAVLDRYVPADLGESSGTGGGPVPPVVEYMKGEGGAAHAAIRAFRDWLLSEEGSDALSSDFIVAPQHGDLNLKNVLIDSQKLVWIIDFAQADTEGLVMRDLCKFETTLLLEYAGNFGAGDPGAGDPDLMALIENLYGEEAVLPWETAVKRSDLLGRTLAQLRGFARDYAGGHARSSALQFYALILFFVSKSNRYSDYNMTQHAAAVGISALVCRRIRALAHHGSAKSDTSKAAPGIGSGADESSNQDAFAYVQSLFLRYSTIGDPMTGERLDILQQCASVRIMSSSAKEELSKAAGVEAVEDYMESDDDDDDVDEGDGEGEGEGEGDGDGATPRRKSRTSHSAVRWILDKAKGARHLLVLGKPAGGKTVLLKQLVLVASMGAGSHHSGSVAPAYVPVLIPLVELARLAQESAGVEHGDADLLDVFWVSEHRAETGLLAFLRRARQEGALLVLLDGLDEVQDSLVLPLVRMMEVLSGEGHRLVLSTRPTRWDSVVMSHFGKSDAAAEVHEKSLFFKYTRDVPWRWDWCVIMDLGWAMKQRLVKLRLGKPRREEFLQAVESSDDYSTLARSPLLLSMLLHSYNTNGGRLPSDRSSLYETCIDGLLQRLESNKAHTRLVSADQSHITAKRMEFLQQLAYHLHHDKMTRDFHSEAASGVPTGPGVWLGQSDAGLEDGLKAASDRGRLPLLPCVGLDKDGKRLYRFLHLTFQEFLMASSIAEELVGAVRHRIYRDPSLGPQWTKPEILERLGENRGDAHTVLKRHFGGQGLPLLENDWFKHVVSLLAAYLSREESGRDDAFLAFMLCLQTKEAPQTGRDGAKYMAWSAEHKNGIAWAVGETGCDQLARALARAQVGADVPAIDPSLPGTAVLSSLCMEGSRLTEKDARSMADGLRSNRTLTELFIGANRLSDAGATCIAGALKVNTTLTALYIGDCGIGPQGATAIADGIMVNVALTKLDLWNNKILPEGAESIAKALVQNTTLVHLNVPLNEIGIDGAASFGKCLVSNTTLRTLDLMANLCLPEGATALAEGLKVNGALFSLLLRGNRIQSKGLRALASALMDNDSLTLVNLEVNEIDCEGASALADALRVNQHVQTLNLSNNEIKLEGVRALGHSLHTNHSVDTLILSHNPLESGGVASIAEALEHNETLQKVDLQDTRCGTDGARTLASALGKNKSVTDLNLSSNCMGREGCVDLAKAVARHPGVVRLVLSNNELDEDGCHEVVRAFTEQGPCERIITLELHSRELSDEGKAAVLSSSSDPSLKIVCEY